jgi:hypothetical protein
MQQSEEMQGEAKQELGEAVNASLGLGEGGEQPSESVHDELPEMAKKRLGMQEKRHKKEMRKLQSQLDEMRDHLRTRPEPLNSPENGMNPYSSQPENGSMDDTVYKAVARAMEMQKMQEHKAREAEKMQHVQKSYRALQDNLDNASGKYEDFDDIVKSEDAPYTDAMRDAALLIENAPDVLYHLGKDKEKLKRISELHPLDQAKEVIKLSVALMSGNGSKQGSVSQAKPLGQVKNNPITSNTVNEGTSVGELRKRMKDGGKKWG